MFNYSKYKNLFYNLLSSELKLRYRGSFLGFLWTLIEPALIILILLFVFSSIFKADIPLYAPYLVTGFIAWFFFANGTSLLDVFISKGNLINKINFPIQIIVFSSFFSILILSAIQFVILEIFFISFNIIPSINLLLLPFLIALQSIFILGILFILSSLFVFIKDLRHIWNILLQVGFFATPIVYPVSLLEDKAPLLLTFNPMAHFISAYRDIMVYNNFPGIGKISLLLLFALLSFVIGFFIFKKMEIGIKEEV